eukprot:m.331797 g.331797  ORF g.331797 m.331797 type:complete len:728 (+) comp16795_c0_seq1:223-2406(+)
MDEGLTLNLTTGSSTAAAPKKKKFNPLKRSIKAKIKKKQAVQRLSKPSSTDKVPSQAHNTKSSSNDKNSSQTHKQEQTRNKPINSSKPSTATKQVTASQTPVLANATKPQISKVYTSKPTKNLQPKSTKQTDTKRQILSSLFDPGSLETNQSLGEIGQELKKPKKKDSVFTVETVEDLDLDERFANHLKGKMGIEKLTQVQKLTIPTLLRRRDALVQSATGTGKTLCYGIPVIHDLQKLSPQVKRENGPYALILLPTRELALQSFEAIQKLVQPYIWIVAGIVMGGEKKKSEKARLRKGVNILVSTPGRLVDHMDHTRSLSFGRVRWLILDEADRLLEQGFEEALQKIIKGVHSAPKLARMHSLCNVLLSATLNTNVERLAMLSLKDPTNINAMKFEGNDTDNGRQFQTSSKLTQHYTLLPCKLRLVSLLAFIKWKIEKDPLGKGIAFYSSRGAIEFYKRLLEDGSKDTDEPKDTSDRQASLFADDLSFFFLHGGQSQQERTQVFRAFSSAKKGFLFCTDVASRGLHLPKVKWILQGNPPTSIEEYVHRVGRTARLDTDGHAIMFLLPSETGFLDELRRFNFELIETPITEILENLVGHRGGTRLSREAQLAASKLQQDCEQRVVKEEDLHSAAVTAFKSFVRAYATYPHEYKHIFHVKKLHLGHLAKSFGMREPPSNLANDTTTVKQLKSKKRKAAVELQKKTRARQKALANEFSDGLSTSKRQKT